MKCNNAIPFKTTYLNIYFLAILLFGTTIIYGQSPPVRINTSSAGPDHTGFFHNFESTSIEGNTATFSIYIESPITIHELSASVIGGLQSNFITSIEYDPNAETGLHQIIFNFDRYIAADRIFYVAFSYDYKVNQTGLSDDKIGVIRFDNRDGICTFNYDVKNVDFTISGVKHNYDLIVQTNSPQTVKIERTNTVSSLINAGDLRWRDLGNDFYGFYVVEPFDLQLTDCSEHMFNFEYWPSSDGSCWLSHRIECTNRYINEVHYNYELIINTSAPEDIIIENTYYLDELLSGDNPHVRVVGTNTYGILFVSPFDLQITDCAGYTFTNQSWPNCRSTVISRSYDSEILEPIESTLVYPNPATDVLNVKGNAKTTYDVFDATGKYIDRILLNNKLEGKIKVSEWEEGVYFVKDINSDDIHQIVKIN